MLPFLIMPISTPTASAFNNTTVSSTALDLEDVGFTAAQVKAADRMRLTVETNLLRYRYDGSAPTTSVGHQLAAGDVLILEGQQNIESFSIIAVSTDGAVFVTLESI